MAKDIFLEERIGKLARDVDFIAQAAVAHARNTKATTSDLRNRHYRMLEQFAKTRCLKISPWRINRYLGVVYGNANGAFPAQEKLERYESAACERLNKVPLLGGEFPEPARACPLPRA